MDDHSVYVGNIQSCLNNSGGNQYIHISIDKIIHYLLQFPLTHLSMCKIHSGLRHKSGYPKGYFGNVIDSIIYVIHLSTPAKLPADGFPNSLLIILHNVCLDRHTIHRRLFQNAHITDTDETHMKSSRNWRCRQRQYIHIFFHLLDLLLVSNTKALLLINDQKSKIFKFHIF